ncbi:MAG: RNA polymerase subunit sigma [Rhizobiales bacterium 65-79]|jgi:RNA polymerase sigma-70 factor (ECF subfamily)|nr:sigma-70 family RNA polymerase sigma factor [Hyphomicrobiales bacterium]OJU00241.1 MAG: RNA polymerase subunit sigma [Rhizobiales bacterium 65-79]
MRGKTAVANGERSAELFREVVLPHLADALSLARWLTGNAHDAEDVVQEACLKAHAGIGSYQGGNARAWLLAIVRNASYTWLARNRSRTLVGVGDIGDLEDLAPPSNPTTGEGNPEAALIARADSAVLERAIEALPHAFREIVVLRDLNGLSYREIAAMLGLPIGTVMSRLARARGRLMAEIRSSDARA